MQWVTYLALALVGGFFGWPLIGQLRNEITIYPMFCATGRVNGVCRFEEQTANPTTYKVFPDQQSVIYWVGDAAPTRLASCAVRDVSNWRCQSARAGGPNVEHIMSDGNFTENAEPPLIATTTLFYPAPRWHWWAVAVREMWTGKK
jgi:hypothetical protein